MFEISKLSSFGQHRWILGTCTVYALCLAGVLRPPDPKIVKVQQLRQGSGGHSLARLYWNSDFVDAASSRSSSKKAKERVVLSKQLESPSKSLQLRLQKREPTLASNRQEEMGASGKSSTAATAGVRYGSLANGDLTGTEVRPALWISGPNPAIVADEFAQGLEGSVIVEITIDENGNVVATQLLQSLSSSVDAHVIEALQMAHFIPAKRNGTPIASKQDVYYHFPR